MTSFTPTAGMGKLMFLDIDINHSREAYARAADFVDATNLRYNFSSKNIAELGGRERESIKEFYNNDFDWSTKGPIITKPQLACRIIIELFEQSSPLACENFEALCLGNKGLAKSSNMPLSYKNVKFHRIIPGFIAQGGDFVFQNGSGGESIWGKKFKDERGGLSRKHDKAGIVSMCNGGKNSNTSQFFFTFVPCPQLDGKHVVFGQIVSGMEVLDAMSVAAAAAAAGSEPAVSSGVVDSDPTAAGARGADVVITECGVFTEGMLAQGHWTPGGAFEPVPTPTGSGDGDDATGGADVVVLASAQTALEKYQAVLRGCHSSALYTLDPAPVLQKIGAVPSGKLVVVMAPGVDETVKQSMQSTAAAGGQISTQVLCVKPADALAAITKALSALK